MGSISKSKTIIFTSIVLISLVVSVNAFSMTVVGAQRPGTSQVYDLEFVGYVINADLTVTFTYRVESGPDDPAIKQWEIYSDLFSRDSLVDVSERYAFNPSKQRLRFTEKYEPGEVRDVSFTLVIDYSSMSIVDVPYTVRSPPFEESGTIEGPGTPTENMMFESLGNISTIFPLSLAVLLVTLIRRGVIQISLA